jgi:glycerophosphoryl diester phosphodiesterase
MRPELDWIATRPIAHRGLHDPACPENSLAAFDRACRYGFPIELDVQLTADGEAAVVHDHDLMHVTGEPGLVRAMAYDQIRRARLFGTDQHVPTLDEVLDLVAGRVPVLVEIKNFGAVDGLEPRVLNAVRGYRGVVAVQSFNPMSMRYFRLRAPEIGRGQISGLFRDIDLDGARVSRVGRVLLRTMALNTLSQPDFIAYQLEGLPAAAVSLRRRLGLPVLVWTVRSPADEARARRYADNIIFEGFLPGAPAHRPEARAGFRPRPRLVTNRWGRRDGRRGRRRRPRP